jgi:hypothetical protein
MISNKHPFWYTVQPGALPEEWQEFYTNNYPEEYIREYCANPDVSEHASSLDGNFSAPVIEEQFRDWIKYEQLPLLKNVFLRQERSHDHHYVNFHMDDAGSSLEVHNDLKNFRWLITSQIYLDNSSDGVRLLNWRGEPHTQLMCENSLMYSIFASPWSWHDVLPIKGLKRSILFRVGKRRHNTVAHPESTDTAYVIVNRNHSDIHYAKLGQRMGNLTEAWLHNQGVRNIYHTDWRADTDHVIQIASARHRTVRCVPSGFFPDQHPDLMPDSSVLRTGNSSIDWNATRDFFLITDQNYSHVADTIFRRTDWSNTGISVIQDAENIMKNYYDAGLHLNYQDLVARQV